MRLSLIALLLAGPPLTHAQTQTYPVKPVHLIVPFPPSSGTGSHLSGELLQVLAGIKLTHVPYKGTSPAITDLIGGQVPMMFSVIPTALPQIRAARLRAIAVTGAQRMPEVPTVAESGLPEFESTLAYGILAPRGTPEAVPREIHAQIARVTATREFRERIEFERTLPLQGTSAGGEMGKGDQGFEDQAGVTRHGIVLASMSFLTYGASHAQCGQTADMAAW